MLHQPSGQKVLVTGASGFIGSHLCDRLSKDGAEVHAVSRTLRHTDPNTGIQWWQGKLEDIDTVRNILDPVKPEVIFHLASHVAGSRSLELVLPTLHSNLVSTVNLLTVATEIGCRRLVLIGSLEEPEPDHNQVPCSPYAAAKSASSAYGRMFHELYQTPVVIARLFMVYGSGQQDRRKLIPYVTLSLLQGQAPKLSSGQRLVDWIYVDDVVDGLLVAAQAPNVEGCTVDLGSGILVSIRTVVQQLSNLVGAETQPLFGALPDRPMEQVRVANTTYSYDKLGWQPATSLERGLELTVDWYRKQPSNPG